MVCWLLTADAVTMNNFCIVILLQFVYGVFVKKCVVDRHKIVFMVQCVYTKYFYKIKAFSRHLSIFFS